MKFVILSVILIAVIFISGCISLQENNLNNSNNQTETENANKDYSEYATSPKYHQFTFIRNLKIGTRETIRFTTYNGVNSYLANQSRGIWYNPDVDPIPTAKDFVLKYINDPVQDYYLKSLTTEIQSLTIDKDEQARIAISLVQNIPYDNYAIETNTLTDKYPYEIVYTEKGVCGDKSRLIIYLLKNLGFGTAYFVFENENHAAAGIKCPAEYSYMNSGYCFVEATDVSLIGQSNNLYVDVGRLSYRPKIYKISDGLEYQDIVSQIETAKAEITNGTRYAVTDKSGAIIARKRGSMDEISTYPDIIIKYPDY